jgi:hypothetical protein
VKCAGGQDSACASNRERLLIEGLVHLIYFIDEQDTALVLFDRFERWACNDVRLARHLALDFDPIGQSREVSFTASEWKPIALASPQS